MMPHCGYKICLYGYGYGYIYITHTLIWLHPLHMSISAYIAAFPTVMFPPPKRIEWLSALMTECDVGITDPKQAPHVLALRFFLSIFFFFLNLSIRSDQKYEDQTDHRNGRKIALYQASLSVVSEQRSLSSHTKISKY